MKKVGFILLLAGLTFGLVSIGDRSRWSNAIVAGLLLVAGTVLLVVGMRRDGPRDEELPTAEARRTR